MPGYWHSCNPEDLRNGKVELQRKMKVSFGAVIYTACCLNHFHPANPQMTMKFNVFPHNILSG